MISAWACPFKGHLHGELWGMGYYRTLFSPSIRSKWFPMTSLRFTEFCETQRRHSVKTRLYNTPSPILHSVKRSEVTR